MTLMQSEGFRKLEIPGESQATRDSLIPGPSASGMQRDPGGRRGREKSGRFLNKPGGRAQRPALRNHFNVQRRQS